jgi:hypothetical protein
MSWLMQSKAFSRSQNMLPTVFLLFGASSIALIKLKLAFAVDDFVLKQNCLLTNMMFI